MKNIHPHHPAKLPEDLRTWAREMRGRMTDAEALLWKLLRNRRIAGAKFRRQHPMGRYILDFYCDEKRLCIELDGGQHMEAAGYDRYRDAWLREQGVHVLRFWNNQVLTEMEGVIEAIYQTLVAAVPTSSLPCRAHTGLQACVATLASGMPLEFPASPPNPSPACGRGE